jgi:hypothetical protein
VKIKVVFGLGGPVKTCDWYRDIEDFYKVISLGDVRHTMANYRPDANKEFEYIVHYNRVGPTDPNDLPIQTWEDLVRWSSTCECGVLYSSASSAHSRWCPKYANY